MGTAVLSFLVLSEAIVALYSSISGRGFQLPVTYTLYIFPFPGVIFSTVLIQLFMLPTSVRLLNILRSYGLFHRFL